VTDLAARVREAAVLEGDFLLRSGRRSRFYVDKYRFGTRPDLLAEIGEALALRIGAVEPQATRIAAPEVGAIALAAAASLRSGLPFVIVRKAPKEYGTTKRLEGAFEPGERLVVVEDVVTSGGAALEAVAALREAGLRVSTAVCVVDREEGGVDELARAAIRLRPLFRAEELRRSAARAHG
jgi:orotate phosphoribosyltransferase